MEAPRDACCKLFDPETPPAAFDARAVNGVGALIKDFLGVSKTSFFRTARLADDVEPDVLGVAGTVWWRPLPITKGCRRAPDGLIRFSGSQIRHFAMKSTKSSSLHRRTCCKDLEPGLRFLPLEFVTIRGLPLDSAC